MKKHFIIIIVCFCLSACTKDWLDLKPNKNQTIPTTLSDMQSLMDNSATSTSALGAGDIASDLHYLTEKYWGGVSDNFTLTFYTWKKSGRITDLPDWIGAYNAILQFNVVLEGLEKMKTVEDLNRSNQIKGDALFHRSRLFHELTQVFGAPYKPGTNNTDLSIALRLSSDINLHSTRSNVQDVYQRIIEDVKQAIPLLPITSTYKTRGSKPAAYALLSRVYIDMADYDNGFKYADSCLKLVDKLMDFNKISPTAANFGVFNDEVILHTLGVGYSELTYEYKIEQAFYDSYTANDLRKTLFFEKLADGTIGFKGNYNNDITPFYGYTTSEGYLNRAECLARLNKVPEAIADLNKLMITRYKTGQFIPFTAITKEQALVIILNERKKELIRRGVRWSDLRRLNQDTQHAVTLTRTIGGKTYTLEPNSIRYILPLPDDVVEISGMPQNPGWTN